MTAPMSTSTAVAAVERSLERIRADGRAGIWIQLVDPERALATAAGIDERMARGQRLPLAGMTLAVKGNIDVEGLDTTAGCPAYAYRPNRSAAVVRALTDAGAVVVGVTNLDQFATGLVGTRSPYGVCPNAHWDGLISGGSSSGSAVAVAAGLVDIALGTDTAGSGRVPAAANGIVGLKPTRGRLSTAGVVPACASLDCVSVFAREVGSGALAVSVAAGFDPEDPWSRSDPLVTPSARAVRLGVPDGADLDFDDAPASAQRFRASVGCLVDAISVESSTVNTVTVEIDHLLEAGRLLYDGAFVAERYAAVGEFVEAHAAAVDPVVGAIIRGAAELPAWRLAADTGELRRLARFSDQLFAEIDVLVVPTVPRIPTVEEVAADPIGVNAMLGTYTNFVNLLDLCALTLPVVTPEDPADSPPTSLTLIAPAWHDQVLVELARQIDFGRAPADSGLGNYHQEQR